MTSPEIATTYYQSKMYSGGMLSKMWMKIWVWMLSLRMDQKLGFRAPKLTISYKWSLGRRKVCSFLQSDSFLIWTDWLKSKVATLIWVLIRYMISSSSWLIWFSLNVSLQMEKSKKNPIVSKFQIIHLGVIMFTSYNQFFLNE